MTRPDGADTLSDQPADPLWDDWETLPRVPTTPELHLDGFDGPLELLLDLAERERIDLGRISVSDMVDQFVAAMARYESRVPLERRADWLNLAARLLCSGLAFSYRSRPRLSARCSMRWSANAANFRICNSFAPPPPGWMPGHSLAVTSSPGRRATGIRASPPTCG